MSTGKVNKDSKTSAVKKQGVSMKLHADTQSRVTIAKDPIVGDFGLVVVYSQAQIPIAEFVVSHPIGVTDYDDNVYVINRQKDIQILKARVADPAHDRLQTEKNKIKMEILESGGVIEKTPDGWVFSKATKFPGIPFERGFEAAKAKRDQAKKDHDTKVSGMKLKRGQKKPTFDSKLERFYSPEEVDLNDRIKVALFDGKFEQVCKSKLKTTHRTLLDDDAPQKELKVPGVITQDLTLTQVMDKLQVAIWKLATGANQDKKDVWEAKSKELADELRDLKAQVTNDVNRLTAGNEVIAKLKAENNRLKGEIDNLTSVIQKMEDEKVIENDEEEEEDPDPKNEKI